MSSLATAPILISEPHRHGLWGNTIITSTTTIEHYAAHGYYDTHELLWIPTNSLVISSQSNADPLPYVPEGVVCAANATHHHMINEKYHVTLPASLFAAHSKSNFDILPCYVTVRRFGIPPKVNQLEYAQRRCFDTFRERLISIIAKLYDDCFVRSDSSYTEIIAGVRGNGLQYDVCKYSVNNDADLSNETIGAMFKSRVATLTESGLL